MKIERKVFVKLKLHGIVEIVVGRQRGLWSNHRRNVPNELKATFTKISPYSVPRGSTKGNGGRTKEERRAVPVLWVESIKGRRQYEKYLSVAKQLAVFVASTNVPNSIVDNEEFWSFVKVLES